MSFNKFFLQCYIVVLAISVNTIWAEETLNPENELSLRAQQGQGQKQKYVPISVMNCPVLKNASCMTGDDAATTCNCDGLKKTDVNKRRNGQYSCPNGKCQYCANKYGNCKVDGFSFSCCDSSLSCVNAKGYDYACFKICHPRRIYETCKDSNGRTFSGYYTGCKGSAPNTFVECPDISSTDDIQPVECSATGGKCNFLELKNDACCKNFACAESGICEAECKEGDDKCEPRPKKNQRCYKEVKTVTCKDSTGRNYTARYLGCNGGKPNTFFECAGETTTVRTCGVTGATCEAGTYFKDNCCTNFVCMSGVCKAECPEKAQNCTVDKTKLKKKQTQTE